MHCSISRPHSSLFCSASHHVCWGITFSQSSPTRVRFFAEVLEVKLHSSNPFGLGVPEQNLSKGVAKLLIIVRFAYYEQFSISVVLKLF